MIYHLSKFALNKKQYRLILDEGIHGDILQSVEAEPVMDGDRIIKSAWRIARELIDESALYHIENFGWISAEA